MKTNEIISPLSDFAFSNIFGEQLRWGDDYDKLHQVISIVICNHKLLEEEDSYINVYELRNDKNRSFTGLLKLVTLELPKLPEAEDSAVWPWLRFFTCKTKEEFEMLAKKYPELKKPIRYSKKMSLFEMLRDVQFHKNLAKVDKRMLILQAKMDGHEEKALEIARKFKAMGLPIEQIAEGTGISPETLASL